MTALFSYGFRPFFLLASLSAVSSVLLWVSLLLGRGVPRGIRVSMEWHAHEMLFGFGMAMVAGFLLTAVPNWTKTEARKGPPLVFLVLLWTAARLGSLLSNSWWLALLDLAFIPALLSLIVGPLWRRFNSRTFLFVPILVGLWIGNILYYLRPSIPAFNSTRVLYISVTLILLLVVIIGGRVIPFFTRKALNTEPRKWKGLDDFASLTVLMLPLLEYFPVWLVVLWTVLGTLAHGVRMWAWAAPGLWRVPLLWVLYLGYSWVVFGVLSTGLGRLGYLPNSVGLHAFTAGAVGMIGLGIMARASLGHTGRALKAPKVAVLAFVLVQLSALARVFGPVLSVSPRYYLLPSGLCWGLGFLLFFFGYWKILTSPRADA